MMTVDLSSPALFNCHCISFYPQRGGGRHGEGEPAAETVHVSVRLQQLADCPVGDTLQRKSGIKADVRRTNMLLMF